MSEINYVNAKKLVLDRLRQWAKELPVAERRRPRIVLDMKSYSVLDLIAQVERNSQVGKEYVFDEAKRLNYVVK
ncbi:hypothetical protein CH330_01300 [candidate division WOR-3 bacterium JGI_Cruoil_03_51_56]|uniref:Uncharacterized protein n=1 Tax=candidate division WOR-3 bacterium JGI_Cruoil_03_51_56 TaxID=1973747 RepID=A0A235BXH9_UNCW3|nr:MAG: hypothetical protein CH330_01300 [candidate division WOR-3 bacterium JGI_Cruoil_03_51_56]